MVECGSADVLPVTARGDLWFATGDKEGRGKNATARAGQLQHVQGSAQDC